MTVDADGTLVVDGTTVEVGTDAEISTAIAVAVASEAATRASADALLAPIASPTFTGVPAGPTAAAGTSTTQFATTAFVTAQTDAALWMIGVR